MNKDDLTLKAEVAEVKAQLADALHRLARAEGTVEQLNRSIASGNRMTNWQFIGFVVVMAGTLFGTLSWATSVLERRVDQVEKNLTTRIDQVEKNLTTVFQKSEENLNKRFEDLHRVVLSQQRR
jgi:phage terminase Nu1 subunit (DNA packaging protein)